MQFKVTSWTVPVKITEGRLFDSQGGEQAGLFVNEESTIYISGAIPPRRRLHVLLHELRHAWEEFLGLPVGGEAEKDNVASFTADVMRQLKAQGGEAALMRLRPDGVVDDSAGPATLPPARFGAECCGCGGVFPASHIVTEPSAFNVHLDEQTVERKLYCDHCGHVQKWVELATPMGRPTGVVVQAPERMKGEAVGDFLRRHGHLYACVPS